MKKHLINQFTKVDGVTPEDIENKELFTNSLKKVLYTGLFLVVLTSCYCTFSILRISQQFPSASLLETCNPDQSTQIFDMDNNLVANIYADEDRILVPLSGISPDLQRAVIAVEDIRFYQHSGIDLIGTVRAAYSNSLNKDSIQVGSTITQQLVKNIFLTPKRSLKRKFVEALLAVKVENKYSKDKILEKYLNQIYFGNRAYGIEKAAKRYFAKTALELNLAEASLLAGLIKAPELYSPYNNYKEAKQRQKIVLTKMYQDGIITLKQSKNAFKEPLSLASQEFSYSKYPYFVDYVSYLLRQKYGDNVVRRAGLKVYTTLDPTVQKIAEDTIIKGVKSVAYSGVKQGALVSINVKNGYIQAIVGGVDYAKSQFNRAILSKRATGSGFKPIVYLTGFRLGLITPDMIIRDAPIAYKTKWNVWRPHNWDGRYMGPMTITKALTLSRNTPTVRIALKSGIDAVIETARLLGIKSPIDRGYSIVLGSSGISPLEIATLYSTLARDGVYLEPTAIRYIEDRNGNLLEETNNTPVRVISSKFIRQLNSILINVVVNGTGRSAKLKDRTVAGKTGTTDDIRDVWFSGFTPDTATTIWMGNDENTSLNGVFSSNCAILWRNFSKEYYSQKNIMAESFPEPEKDEKKEKEKAKKLKEEKEKKKNEFEELKSKKIYSGRVLNPNSKSQQAIKPPVRTYRPELHDSPNIKKKASSASRAPQVQKRQQYRPKYNQYKRYNQ